VMNRLEGHKGFFWLGSIALAPPVFIARTAITQYVRMRYLTTPGTVKVKKGKDASMGSVPIVVDGVSYLPFQGPASRGR